MIRRPVIVALVVLLVILVGLIIADRVQAAPLAEPAPEHGFQTAPSPQTHPRVVHVTRSLARKKPPPAPPARAVTSRPAPVVTGSGWVMHMMTCIARYESNGNPRDVDPSHTYWGRYQFSDPTWYAATGLHGHASAYDAAVQDAAFLSWFDNGKRRHQWPNTYARCRAIYGGPA